jgi:arabinogalactan oligomer/maltooligosaccharide transport system permease protein
MFSGTAGLVAKLVLLGIFNALVIWALEILATDGKWIALIISAAATIAIDVIYLLPRRTPAKFLIPGTVFLIAFTVIPIVYTVNIAFTNYSTGHILTKPQAIESIKQFTLSPPANGKTYNLTPARDENGNLVLLLADADTGKPYVGTEQGLKPLDPATVKKSLGAITAAQGYTAIKGAELFNPASGLDKQLDDFRVPVGRGAIHPEGIDNAVELEPTLRYDSKTDTFTQISNGVVYRDNNDGSFVAGKEELEPGWKTYVGFKNFSRIIHDPLIRNPFLRVLAWTFAFATFTVLLSFALGLFLAITLQRKFRLQRVYRVILVLPYAIPAFLTILVWGGLLNDEFGIANKIIHALFNTKVPWLFDTWWARVSVLLVSIWLTFPYFFLVSLGALQSIPGELVEAARVDGAGPLQVFRKITLPLLLVAVGPLLIASFAFNFNNFNVIYLLTKGGPASGDQSIAGGTDILISYTYKLAFATGKGGDYALAAGISILIFFIVATISGVAFWRSKALETLR